uniref:PQ-loop repeat-containing protein 2 n=1 Tax=Romanomermis culicivorax TaxID=13658 RepID=A0A915IB85_ROMCU
MFRPLAMVLTNVIADAENCTNGVAWIFQTFGQCVETNVEYGAFVLGFISFLLWLLPVLPQIYQNYKRGHCDDALSLFFLIFWFLGDSLNLSGAILAQQLPIQVYTGVYFIIQDCLILGQYYYLQVYNGWRVTLFRELGRPTVSCFMFLGLVTIFGAENGAFLLSNTSANGTRAKKP